MIGILHRYILRELLKTFALTATGLTLMFGMGGGLLNLVRVDQISAGDVARLLLWFIPLVASFMLPIAAMLSCALVYGRLAADNELDACKASGINILRLLASAVGLAVLVSVIAFYLSNFTVPHLFQRINEIAQGDIQDLLVAKLRDQGHLPFSKNYIIYADDARKLDTDEAARYLGESNPKKRVVLIEKAAFVEFREEDPLRTGTAEAILLIFDKTKNSMSVSARMLRVRVFDHQRQQFTTWEDQPLTREQIPAFAAGGRMKLKFFDLAELFYFQDHPIETPVIQDKLKRFRQETTGLALAGQVLDSMVRQKVAVLTNPSGQEFRIRATKALLDDQGRRPRLELREPTIEQVEDAQHSRFYKADEGSISFQTGSDGVTVGFVLRKNVTLKDLVETPKPVRQMSPYELPSITIPFESIRTNVSYSDEQILESSQELPLPDSLRSARKGLSGMVRDMGRQITAAVHARLTMSSSTLVLVLLAAALGIVLRGGHALTAFGVAFVPTVIVVLVITTGRQLAETGNTSIVGLATMWGIIAVMAVVDAAIVFGGIRR
jgi:lipopolysaccharide export LptBFGC system permease protein LptF